MSTDTKERILDVAECLFADSGFATTSLRDITAAAGANLASVNYHFGSKEGLLLAVLHRRFEPVNQRRLDRLEKLEHDSAAEGPTLEEILRAFLTPPFEMRAELGDRGDSFFRLLGRVHTETNADLRQSFIEQFHEVFSRFTAALARALPSMDRREQHTRMWFVIGAMAYTMIWGNTMCAEHENTQDPQLLVESLIPFCAAGLCASTTPPARVRLERRRRRPA